MSERPPIEEQIEALLALPRDQQLASLDALLPTLPVPELREAWNTAFGPGSLFEAWTLTSIAGAIYAANAATLRAHLSGRSGWRVIEVGGGDGRLWRSVFDPSAGAPTAGELVVIDPAAEAHQRVAAALPPGITLTSLLAPVQDVELPEADAIVCSLTLHHLAGADAAERRAHGLSGPGKVEVMQRFGHALRARRGLGLLNEADVFCDLALPPGAPALRDNIFDSYVRRCARSLIDDLRGRADAGSDLRGRWRVLLQRWFLEQIAVADAPVAERDVYELDVARWLALFERAGLRVRERGFTDRYGLFHRYLFEPGGG